MYRTHGVWALLALCVGLVSSFSWDIVVARSNRLEFYNEGTLAHTATPASHTIKWISYDPVHDRVLFTEKYNKEDAAFSFEIENQTTKTLIKKKSKRYLKRLAYDPATELLFGTVIKSIYSFPLGPGNNNEIKGDLLITLDTIPREVAVDSCGGYIYWRANNIIERALFNGSEREVIIDNSSNATVQYLTVDSQKIYWIETRENYDGGFSIESADLDGNNRKTLYSDTESDSTPAGLTVSKEFITWGDSIEKFFWQLPKNPTNDTDIKPNKIAMNTTISSCGSDIAANYKIEERTQGVPNCDALLSLLPDLHVCLNASVFCIHGTKVVGESRCDCVQGYIGERCDISVCENYCSQGDCNVSAEGQAKCRCHAGYTGERCDVSLCENYCLQGECNVSAEGQPKCRCHVGYTGERCDVSICENYCSQGDCNVSAEGQPKCRCNAGYTGERCDTSVCEDYCIHGNCNASAIGQPKCRCNAGYMGERCDVSLCENYCLQGDCSVSAEGQPKCRCNAGYTGERCDTSVCEDYCIHGECNASAIGQPKCRCNAGYTGERCDVSLCENYCLQGDCNVSSVGQPKCRCNAGYTGERCDVSLCENYCLQGECNVNAEGQPKCRCNAGYSGMRCDVSACHKHCLNNGVCSLNNDNEPVCKCTGQYKGKRCDVPTTPQTVSSQTPHGFEWLPMKDDELPPNAIFGGYENGNAIYIARAYHTGHVYDRTQTQLIPGKYVASTGIAYFPWRGNEHVKKQFEILCGFNPKWVKTNYDNIPKNAFVGGHTSLDSSLKSEPLYICRAKIDDRLICGKAHAYEKRCYLPYKGLEKVVFSYEILVED